ncbi:hypothetical protein J14TS2_52720 [Bacillus sp. J14TS2]|uniref:DinB/UmuC family translesion DNA polymerase n=1 Tax=Bacillus sp. J14TS2 TaxID=2807188 RepID=UPI001B2335F9|nr:hypothetical protein [Bacillus sp. J14TS2]GIN74797.1 hypothetical protein J14TS2_52720 [Bacillus sp. J14TS2]
MGLVLTVGVGDNPLLAKLALDHQANHDERHGFIAEWRYETIPQTVWRISPLSEFWGIGEKTEASLNRIGIHTIRELTQYDLSKLKARFGVIGDLLFFAHGIDRTLLSDTYTPKSTSFSRNQILNRDYNEKHKVEIVIREMTGENVAQLRKHHLMTGVIKLSIGYSRDVVKTGFNRQIRIEPTDSSKKLKSYMLFIFNKYYECAPVRVINVTFGKLQPKKPLQLSLFEPVEVTIENEELDKAVDFVRRKYGYTSILQTSSLLDGGMARGRAKLVGGDRAGEDEKK